MKRTPNPENLDDLHPHEQASWILFSIHADKAKARELCADMGDAEWEEFCKANEPSEEGSEPPCYDELSETGEFRTVRENPVRNSDGFQTEQCTRCLREVSKDDPEARYKYGEIIACGNCDPEAQAQSRKWEAQDEAREREVSETRRQITLSTARRYVRRYPEARIIGDSINKSAKLYRVTPAGTFVLVAEIPPIF